MMTADKWSQGLEFSVSNQTKSDFKGRPAPHTKIKVTKQNQ